MGSPVFAWTRLRDVDWDGDRDLLLWFRQRSTGIQCGDTMVTLVAQTWSGKQVTAMDTIQTRCW